MRLGAVTDAGVVDLHAACVWHHQVRGHRRPVEVSLELVPPSMRAFLKGEERSMDAARETLRAFSDARWEPTDARESEPLLFPTDAIRLRPPLPDPLSFRDFYAFEQHVKAGFAKRGEPMPAEWYEFPVYYKGNHLTIIGPDDDVRWPTFTERFDYELEIAAVLGRQGTDIREEDAASYIAGYTVLNDFSARDIQRKEMRVRLGPA
jgi:2-keto-4-pentenoate hydratase/2-oxohepta-3-ene-1,7-dioic acid hydratase in catechol pathway